MRYYNIKLDKSDDFTTTVNEATFLAMCHQGMIDHYDEVQMMIGTYRLRLRACDAYEAAQGALIENAYRQRSRIIHQLNERPRCK